jgi:hypothetical protein
MKPRQTMHHTTRSSGPRRALAGTLLALAGLACGAFAAAQPAGEPEPVDAASVEPVTQDSVPGPAGEISNGDDPEITFSETAEPMELTALVDFVAKTLRINISVRGELKGSVLFNTSKSVRLSKLLPLLDAMLEQNEFSITYDQQSEFYQIQPKSDLPVQLDGELATTKLIEIPNIKPSSLSEAINQILGGSGRGTQGSGRA